MMTEPRPTQGVTDALTGPAALGRLVRRVLLAAVVSGALTILVATLVGGRTAAAGALVGTLLTCVTLALGLPVLAWVTRILPAMSLLVAMTTYVMQVVFLLAAYVVLQRSAEARAAVDGSWLGVAVIVTTVVCLTVQVVGFLKGRHPYFDVEPGTGAEGAPGPPEAGAR
jgi:ATP synthase protein I